mmetsp:Transcript_14979/g.45845  ORF Transcript_14979/g.45845 Transcript_14979/m.45845 type:complete len:303 (-) Transcript_14979:1181-2089(-)
MRRAREADKPDKRALHNRAKTLISARPRRHDQRACGRCLAAFDLHNAVGEGRALVAATGHALQHHHSLRSRHWRQRRDGGVAVQELRGRAWRPMLTFGHNGHHVHEIAGRHGAGRRPPVRLVTLDVQETHEDALWQSHLRELASVAQEGRHSACLQSAPIFIGTHAHAAGGHVLPREGGDECVELVQRPRLRRRAQRPRGGVPGQQARWPTFQGAAGGTHIRSALDLGQDEGPDCLALLRLAHEADPRDEDVRLRRPRGGVGGLVRAVLELVGTCGHVGWQEAGSFGADHREVLIGDGGRRV